MLIAEIRHKLFSVQDLDPEDGDIAAQIRRLLRETQEDLLTADVFGAMKYLPREPYLAFVLKAIAERNPHAEEFLASLPKILSRAEELKFSFWPSYPTPQGIPGSMTEPDVELCSSDALLLFEAKLHSPFGDNQILRELAVALEQANGREPFLVLVTLGGRAPLFRVAGRKLTPTQYVAHTCPTVSSQSLADRLRANRNRVLWISWRGIVGALEAARAEHRRQPVGNTAELRMADDILGDLLELTRMRGISTFRGVGLGSVRPPRPLPPIRLPGLRSEQHPVRGPSPAIFANVYPFAALSPQEPILFAGLGAALEKEDAFRGIPNLCKSLPDPRHLAPPRLVGGRNVGKPKRTISTLAARWPHGSWRFKITQGEMNAN